MCAVHFHLRKRTYCSVHKSLFCRNISFENAILLQIKISLLSLCWALLNNLSNLGIHKAKKFLHIWLTRIFSFECICRIVGSRNRCLKWTNYICNTKLWIWLENKWSLPCQTLELKKIQWVHNQSKKLFSYKKIQI